MNGTFLTQKLSLSTGTVFRQDPTYIIYVSELVCIELELWCMFFFFVAQIVDVFYFRPIFPSFIPLNKKWQTPRIVCHDHVEESCFDCKLPPRGLQLHRFFSIFRSVLPERMRRHCESLRGSKAWSREVKKNRHDIFRYDGMT